MTDRNLGAGPTSDVRLLARVWDWSAQAVEPIDAAAIARSTAEAADQSPAIGQRLRANLPFGRGSRTGSTTERTLLVLVLLGLLVVAMFGASLMGERLPDVRDSHPLPAVVPSLNPSDAPLGLAEAPPCPTQAAAPNQDGPLPTIGAPVDRHGSGVIAAPAETGVVALDPEAQSAPPAGLWRFLTRYAADTANVSSLSWSPDGQWLAVVLIGRHGNAACADLYVVPAAGGAATRVTENELGVILGTPAWSPDGQWLVVSRDTNVLLNLEEPTPLPGSGSLEAIRLDETLSVVERRRVLDEPVGLSASWSPLGALAVTAGPTQELTILQPGGAAVSTGLTQVDAVAWSPAGDTLAIRRRDPERDLITVIRIDESGAAREEARQELPEGMFGINAAPVWSPDGRHVNYAASVDGQSGRTRGAIFDLVVDGASVASTAEPAPLTAFDDLTDGAILIPGLARSPDGAAIAYTLGGDIGANAGVWVMQADGSNARKISNPTVVGISMSGLSWQPVP